MNTERVDQVIALIRKKKIPEVVDAVYRLAPTETAAPKRGSANCRLVAEWLGVHGDQGILLLFAFDKKDRFHDNQVMTVDRTVRMLERLKATGEIYYDDK